MARSPKNPPNPARRHLPPDADILYDIGSTRCIVFPFYKRLMLHGWPATDCVARDPRCRSSRLAVAVLGTVVLTAGGCARQEIGAPLPMAVNVVKLAEEQISSEMRYSATIKELQKVELSFKVPGTIKELLKVPGTDGKPRDVQEGDQVPAGAVLAKLDDGDYTRAWEIAKQRLAQAENQLQAAQANADLAEKDFLRIEKLVKQSAAAVQQLDNAVSRRDSTAAQVNALSREVQAARIAERQARDDLDHCSLKVPDLGRATVAAKYVEPSERVASPVIRAFQLIDVARLRVVFGVPDAQVGGLAFGQTLNVICEPLSGKRFAGRVTKIAPTADLGTRTFPIEVTIDDPGELRPGMIVSVYLGRADTGLLLPMTAVQRGPSKQDFIVYKVCAEAGRTVVRQRRVELGGVYDNRIQVKPGGHTEVAAGDAVVVTGAARLSEGQEVRVLRDAEPKPVLE